MAISNIPDLIVQETKQLPENLLEEVLDFVLLLKRKNELGENKNELSTMQMTELSHLESEFENYKELFPHE